MLLPRRQEALLLQLWQVFKQLHRLGRVILDPLFHPTVWEQPTGDELLHPLPNVIGSSQGLIQPEAGRLGLLGIAPRKPLFPVIPYAPACVQQIPLHELGSMLVAHRVHPSAARSIERENLSGFQAQRQNTL